MWLHVSAIVLRFYYLHRRSVARNMEILFWPLMDLLVWGFVTIYMSRFALPQTVVFLLGSVILWDVLYRSQQGITYAITEEYWAKNIINLFIAPIRSAELIAGLCIVGLIKSIITTIFLGILAFVFYQFNLLTIGPALVPFLANLFLFGWAVGLITMALIFRYGHAAEALIWGVPFLIQPISAVFYPVSVLPPWLQKIAWLLPSTYVFEGMRMILNGGHDGATMLLARSFALNLVYLAIGGLFFAWTLENVRKLGYLSRFNIE
jgi:ABC-2 type transport system permease protein